MINIATGQKDQRPDPPPDPQRLKKILEQFLKSANARGAAILRVDADESGPTAAGKQRARTCRILCQAGELGAHTEKDISALTLASRHALDEGGGIIGEEELSLLWHAGRKENIQISKAGARHYLAIIFDDKTTLGMVRLYASQVASKLSGFLESG